MSLNCQKIEIKKLPFYASDITNFTSAVCAVVLDMSIDGGEPLFTSWANTYSGDLYDTFTTVNTYSATWGGGGGDSNVNTFVYSNSANILQSNSVVNNTSGNWNSVYNSYNTSSANFLTNSSGNSRYVKLSGDVMTGGLSSPSLSTNNLYVAGSTINFFDGTGSIIETLKSSDVGNFKSNYTLTNSRSGKWEETYSNFSIQSGNNTSVYNTVQTNSGNWNYQGTDLKSLTSNWENTYSNFSIQSANNISVYNTFNSNSSNYNSVYNTVNSNSSTNWNYQGSDIKSLTGNWQNTYTGFSSQSSNNLSVYSNVNSKSANWDSTYSTVNTNSATTWNYQGTDIKSLTSNWQNTYSTVSSYSATWGSGSGLTIFSEISSKTSPNNVVPTFGLTVKSLSSDVDFAIIPKGSGALLTQIPDGSASGGDKRGIYATDWQRIRDESFQVASGNYSTIGGGYSNTASGNFSTVAGGLANAASEADATVGGGTVNNATGPWTVIAGGKYNTASGNVATIGGGDGNYASGNLSTIGGGYSNITIGLFSTIGGGESNNANGEYTTIGGGFFHHANGEYATIAGGNYNNAWGNYSTIAGGSTNIAAESYTTIGGGFTNQASATAATVGGGYINSATGDYSTIGGGIGNNASGENSFIAGGIFNNTNNKANTFILGSNIIAPSANYTYVNNLSSQGDIIASSVIYSASGNSNQWNSSYSTIQSQSANNASVYSTVRSNSATTWNYQGTDIKSLTSNWQNTYSTVSSYSATWGAGSSPQTLSFNESNAQLTISNGNTVSLSALSGSSTGGSNIDTGVRALTSNWENTYNTVSSYSATWGSGGGSGAYLPLSGGTMDNNAIISFDNNSRIRQNPNGNGIDLVCSVDYVHRWKDGFLYIYDQSNQIRTVYYGRDVIPGVNYDSSQGYIVGSVYVQDNGNSYICNDNSVGAAVWVVWNTVGNYLPLSGGTLTGALSTTDILYTNGGNSDQWNSTYNTVQTNSSTNWNYQGTDVKSLTGNWQDTYSNFSVQSANNLSVYNNVQTNSGNWQDTYINFNSQSANNLSVYSTVASNSGTWASGTGGGGGGALYYFNQATLAQAPTTNIPITAHQLGRLGSSLSASYTSPDISQVSYDLVAGFLTNVLDPNVDAIPGGIWDFNIWGYSDATANNPMALQALVYTYDGVNAPVLLSTSDDTTLTNNGQFIQRTMSCLVPQTTISLSARIYVEFRAKATSANKSVTLAFGGRTPSHIHTTIPSVGGTGLVKVLDGSLLTPASLLVDADVSATANISQSKINGLTDLANKANSTYSTVNSYSATNWNYQGTDIKALTSNWENTYTTFSTQSSNNLSVYSIVQTNSSTNWNYQGSDIKSLTGNWQNTYSTVSSQSSNNDSVYSTVNSYSATTWNYQGTDIKALTGNWQDTYTNFSSQSSNNLSVYSTVKTYSATTWNPAGNYLPLSGGLITGNLNIFGNLSCNGTQTFNNTIFSTTSAVSVVHVGSGPALWVGNNGTGDIASFYDIDQNVEVLHVGGNNGSFPNVGVKTSTPNVDFTVNGVISASSIIYDRSGNSNQWNGAYSTVQTYSATTWNPAGLYLPLSGGTMNGSLNIATGQILSGGVNINTLWGAGGGSLVYTYLTNSTWTNPSPTVARPVTIILVGGGGGGGGGRGAADGVVKGGGGGGAGGALVMFNTWTNLLSTTEAVFIGSGGLGGTGGVAVSGGGTGGGPNTTSGGNTTITLNGNTLKAIGGPLGNNGTTAAAAGGGPTTAASVCFNNVANTLGGGQGVTGAANGAAGTTATYFIPTGGGGGAGVSSTNNNATITGGAGGILFASSTLNQFGATAGVGQGASGTGDLSYLGVGLGGAGGNASWTTAGQNGGNGGNGGFPGGGGGGGGAYGNINAPYGSGGNGGAGGGGIATIIVY